MGSNLINLRECAYTSQTIIVMLIEVGSILHHNLQENDDQLKP